MILLLCCCKHLLFPEILLLCLLLSWVKTRLSRNTQTTLSAGFSSNWPFKSCSCFVKRYKYISSFQLLTKLFSVLQSAHSHSTKLQILFVIYTKHSQTEQNRKLSFSRVIWIQHWPLNIWEMHCGHLIVPCHMWFKSLIVYKILKPLRFLKAISIVCMNI